MGVLFIKGKRLLFYVKHGECHQMKGCGIVVVASEKGRQLLLLLVYSIYNQSQVNVTKTTTQATKSDSQKIHI